MSMFKVCLHLFTYISLCSCLVKNVKYQANMACNESIELSLDGESSKPAQSAKTCSMLCAGQAGCGGFLYYSGTKACHVVNSSSSMLGACSLPGATFYKIAPVCFTTKPLVAELPDDRLTASSYLDNSSMPLHAKMTNEYSWVAERRSLVAGAGVTQYQFLQVDFMKERTLVSIYTQGTVTKYKLLVSSDCVVFDYLIDQDIGDHKVFRGLETTNDVTPTVKARCVKIKPGAWNYKLTLEIEIFGC